MYRPLPCLSTKENRPLYFPVQRGLGTCWSAQGGLIRDQSILQELGLPEGQEIIAPILLGYPKSIPAMPERKPANIIKVL